MVTADSDRQSGTVKWFNDTKGFGLITPDDDGEDLFVHQSSIRINSFQSLGDGETMEFVVDLDLMDGPNDGGGGGGNGCFKCGESRHMARECSKRNGGSGGYEGGGGGYGGGGGGYGGGRGGGGGDGCYNCDADGHFARDCPTGGGC